MNEHPEEMEICPACDGRGEVQEGYWGHLWMGRKPSGPFYVCPLCHGKKFVTVSQAKEYIERELEE